MQSVHEPRSFACFISVSVLSVLWASDDGCRVEAAGKETDQPMTTWLIIAIAFCLVCVVGMLILKRKQHWNVPAWQSNRPRKSVWMNGRLSAIYVYDEGATNTRGNVWKYNKNGKYFSHTGFDGPYVSLMEESDENE